MTTFILIAAIIVLFFIGVVCPHLAGKIERKSNQKAHWLKRMSNWLWDPLTWWSKKSIEWSRKTIIATAELGKKTHHKLSEKDKKNSSSK